MNDTTNFSCPANPSPFAEKPSMTINAAIAPSMAEIPFEPLQQFEPAPISSTEGVPMPGWGVFVKAYGFDQAQLTGRAVWMIPSLMQKASMIILDTPPHLVHLARNFMISFIAGGAKLGSFAAQPGLKQAVILLSKPSPAELELMLGHTAGSVGSEVDLHQLVSTASNAISLAEKAAGDLIENRLKPRGSQAKLPDVVHVTVNSHQFSDTEQRQAVVSRLKRLMRLGMSVVVIWQRGTEGEWAVPPELGDAHLTVKPCHHATADRALMLKLAWGRFVGERDLMPQVLGVSVKNKPRIVNWTSEDYICDDPELLSMYRMRAAGATLRQIGASLEVAVDASTVSRRLRILDKELVGRS